jgi:hypothetical protein
MPRTATETAETPRVGEIGSFGKSMEDLFKGGQFLGQMYSLVELRRAYHDAKSGFSQSVHGACGKGEWLADVVETDGAKSLPNGFLRVVYVQKPVDVLKSLKTGAYAVSGGTRLSYDCPKSGFVVPGDGKLWHPATGAAIATVDDREKAVHEVAEYISLYPEQFAHMTIPARWNSEFAEQFVNANFNPENPTPEQLAEFITSYQWSPSADTGINAVRRDFWDRNNGPFGVDMLGNLSRWSSDVGARVRSKALASTILG